MATVFSRIIAGELPGRFVWQDEDVVAFLSIAPLRAGHTLVVPRLEVDDWQTVAPALWAHTAAVAQTLGRAVQQAFDAPRIGLVVAGFEVPHVHVHVFPAWDMADFEFDRAHALDDATMDDAAARITAALS